MVHKRTDDRQYGAVFLAINGISVRLKNGAGRIRGALRLARGGWFRRGADEKAAFERIRTQFPELASYDRKGLIRQLRARAIRKGFPSLADYCAYLPGSEEEWADLRENLTFAGTHFFRGSVWPALETACRTNFLRTDGESVRIWCAGCSSGKEVYSVLMLLLEILPGEKLEMLATDYNDSLLLRCREGVYPLRTMDEIPGKYRRYVTAYRAEDADRQDFAYRYQLRFCDGLRQMIHTQRQNLLTDEYPAGFDLILCRNVIKFFNTDARREVQRKLAESLNPGGLLVLSEQKEERIPEPESLGLESRGKSGIYQKRKQETGAAF